MVGQLSRPSCEPEGLSSRGRTAGGEELARLRGGDGVLGASQSEISSMSSHSVWRAGCDAESFESFDLERDGGEHAIGILVDFFGEDRETVPRRASFRGRPRGLLVLPLSA